MVSATIGEGHNATARAVEEVAHRHWPGVEVEWVDALRAMGGWVPRTFNRIYVLNVETTPWLYDFFYDALWRYRWFADACRRFVGAWSGRCLLPAVRAVSPDLVVSTYPLGTAGLDWMRRHGLLDVPLAAVVSDFSPHPFWVYAEADQHLVMSETSARALRSAEPDAVGSACSPPVVTAFRPRERGAARAAAGLPDGFTALISCGSLGFGSVERAARAALRVREVRAVLVVCGRNAALREQLRTRLPDPRLAALGWVEDMPGLMACSDVVISNAGGATALEALACGRAAVTFEPIAGHGRANAELMAEAELADLCPREQDLTALLQQLATDPDALAEREQRAHKHRQRADFDEQVAAMPALPRHSGRRPLRPQDAFFVHAGTPHVPQQTGAVLHLGGDVPAHERAEHIAARITEHAAGLGLLTRRLVLRPGRRPQWAHVPRIDPAEHLRCREVDDPERAAAVLADFFTEPVRTDRPPWELLVLRESADGRTRLLAKMHHALGDGVAVTSALLRLLCDGPHPPELRPAAETRSARERVRGLVSGLLSLAAAGPAPPVPTSGRSSAARSFGFAELPADRVRSAARAHGVSSSVLLVGCVAEALHRMTGSATPDDLFRVMVPRTARTGRNGPGPDAPGNYTASMSVDLPVGPMRVADRLAAVDSALDAPERAGQPVASAAVLSLLGRLPAPLHAAVVRRIYHRRFFSAVVSVLPGRRRGADIDGHHLEAVSPVLSLADGTGVAVGAVNWGSRVGFGVTTDPELAPRADSLAGALREAFAELDEDGRG
nr:wax ester/triacylglycerol synthase domain-containing protein [Saccharopolyspora sp. HNM0983]